MVIGNMLSDSGQQYVAAKDDTGTWRILNTWHEDLKTMNADEDISDDSSAVVVLSEGQFIALIKEAASQGVLENINISTDVDTAELEYEIETKNKEIEDLKDQLSKLKEEKTKIEKVASHSEEFELKDKAMDNILKLVSMQDITKLSRD
jgi:ribonucleotide reductase alpha subunit